MIEYSRLKPEEESFVEMIMKRKGYDDGVIDEALAEASIAKVVERPYIMVSIMWPDMTTNGFSKQCTYTPTGDEWNEEIGLKIAMSRAVRNYPIKQGA